PVVDEHRRAALLERPRHALALLLEARQDDNVDVIRRDRLWPDDPVLVVMLFDDRGHHPAGPDAVAAAQKRFLLAVFVEEGGSERLRVERPKVEDGADLDRCLEGGGATATGAAVPLARLAQVGEARLVVAPSPDSAQMPAVAVC